MQKPGIFGILKYSERSVTGSLLIFIMVIFTETGILCNPENSEPWHIDKPGMLRTLKYFKPNKYSDPVKDLLWNIL